MSRKLRACHTTLITRHADADAIERLRAHPYVRFGVLASVDAALWVVAIFLATLARLGFQTSDLSAEGFALTAVVAAGAQPA